MVALLVAAGGGDTTTPPTRPAPAPPPTQAPGDEAAPPAADLEVGERGSFTVDGMTFVVTFLNRCIPYDEDPDAIDLQALDRDNGAKINLYFANGRMDVSVDGSAISQEFGSPAFGATLDESSIDGGRWTGSATLDDAFDSGETVDVTWDVQVPDDVRDCSL